MKTLEDAAIVEDMDLLFLSQIMNGQLTLIRFIADKAIRNTLEDLHSGIFPSTKTGDYSDVKVITPYGEIPWNDLSRFNDKEIRELMLEIEIKLHNTFSSLIPKLIINSDGTESLMDKLEKMYEKGVSWDISKEEWDKIQQFEKRKTDKK